MSGKPLTGDTESLGIHVNLNHIKGEPERPEKEVVANRPARDRDKNLILESEHVMSSDYYCKRGGIVVYLGEEDSEFSRLIIVYFYSVNNSVISATFFVY